MMCGVSRWVIYNLLKLVFPYEQFDSFEKLSHVGQVSYIDVNSSLKTTITKDEYERFLKIFKKDSCKTLSGWLRKHNLAILSHLLQPIQGQLSNTLLIRLKYAKTRIINLYVQIKSLEKNAMINLYYDKSVTSVKISKKSLRNVVAMVR